MPAFTDTDFSTDADPDLEAFLHIVHISDMHCKAAGLPIDIGSEKKVRGWVSLLKKAGFNGWAELVEERWESGLAGHDPLAHDCMCRFLDHFAQRSRFSGIPTWLVDTGDLSALGDSGSLRTALGWVDEYSRLLKAQKTLVLHGNHDAWPSRFPLYATEAEIVAQQLALREIIQTTWPHTAISTAIPYSDSAIRLNAINSTTGDRINNTLARGIVDMDPPWPCDNALKQLDQLAEQTRQQFRKKSARDFRILAVHHPVHYPPPRPVTQMSMKNDKEVADALARFAEHEHGPLAHLILSGHTHETYPANGDLPPTSRSKQYPPLYEGQIQLIAGSLSQLPRFHTRQKLAVQTNGTNMAYVPQQCQILTFFASPASSRQGRLLMERRIVGRAGTGPYKVLPIPGRLHQVESVVWGY